MMILKRVLKFITVLLLLTNLSGCNMTGLKDTEDAPEIDLLELRDEADSAYLNDDLKTSEENYTILVKEMPEEALHWYRLANIYVRTNRPDAAINLYREAVIYLYR
jgi:cytochrome c-type biogenesis protein CcmH/NrfG